MKKKIFLFSVITIIQLGAFSLSAQQKTESAALYSRIDSYLTAGSKNGFSGAISVVKMAKLLLIKGMERPIRMLKRLTAQTLFLTLALTPNNSQQQQF